MFDETLSAVVIRRIHWGVPTVLTNLRRTRQPCRSVIIYYIIIPRGGQHPQSIIT